MKRVRNTIDLNCDLGEGLDTDKDIIPFISSANIACGYHAGDEATIRQTIDYCLQYDVAIGAHPGFADRANFGRTEMKLNNEELYALVSKQISLMKTITEEKGGRLHHVKPHGALYNMAAADPVYARVISQAVADIDQTLLFYGLSNSLMLAAAEAAGLQPVAEVFADRSYQDNGQLTPRSQPGALIVDISKSVEQVMQMVNAGTVQASDGTTIAITADTVCLHGDGTNAVSFARTIHEHLNANGIRVARILRVS